MSYTYNVTPSSCANWRAALARQAAGGARATLFSAGDSITSGYNGTPHDQTSSWAWRLGPLLNASALGPTEQGFKYTTRGDNSYPDTRRVLGTGWAENNDGSNVAGWGNIIGGPGPTTGTFAFGPVVCDSFTLTTRHFVGASFKYRVDGGAWSASVSAVSDTLTTIPAGTAGPHTLEVIADSSDASARVVLMGLGWVDSTRKYVRLGELGVFGIRTNEWTGGSAGTGPLDELYGGKWLPPPDLTIIAVGTNDIDNAVPQATTITNLTTWITKARAANCDVMLTIPAPCQAADTTEQPTAAYRSAIYSLADSANVPVVDLQTPFGTSWATAKANGLITDNAHPSDAGHDLFAQTMRDAVLDASGLGTSSPYTVGAYRLIGGVATQVGVHGFSAGQVVSRAMHRH
jgi:lysophospholipase L1-like esterase